jgi:hypothetical protein
MRITIEITPSKPETSIAERSRVVLGALPVLARIWDELFKPRADDRVSVIEGDMVAASVFEEQIIDLVDRIGGEATREMFMRAGAPPLTDAGLAILERITRGSSSVRDSDKDVRKPDSVPVGPKRTV